MRYNRLTRYKKCNADEKDKDLSFVFKAYINICVIPSNISKCHFLLKLNKIQTLHFVEENYMPLPSLILEFNLSESFLAIGENKSAERNATGNIIAQDFRNKVGHSVLKPCTRKTPTNAITKDIGKTINKILRYLIYVFFISIVFLFATKVILNERYIKQYYDPFFCTFRKFYI